MSFIVVIPARYASSRLPGKPLMDIGGKTMLQHVFERACASEAREVHIATDDARIEQAARQFTDRVCMTRPEHPSGTDRIQEVATQLGLSEQDIVVNVQGDEPMIPAAAINQVAASLIQHPAAGISSLYEPIHDADEFHSPHVVKVVTDEEGFALYFSRSPIPWMSPQVAASLFAEHQGEVGDIVTGMRPKRHIGIYGYRVSTLNRFVNWQPAPLEGSERLEQLRAMYNGVRIHLTQAPEKMPPGVDTPEDLAAVREAWQRSQQSGSQPDAKQGR